MLHEWSRDSTQGILHVSITLSGSEKSSRIAEAFHIRPSRLPMPHPNAPHRRLSIYLSQCPTPLALHSLGPHADNIPLLTQHNNIVLTPRAPMPDPKNLDAMAPVTTRLDRFHHTIILPALIPARQIRRFDVARVVDEFSETACSGTISASFSS